MYFTACCIFNCFLCVWTSQWKRSKIILTEGMRVLGNGHFKTYVQGHWAVTTELSTLSQNSHLSWQLEGGNLSVTTSSSTESAAFAMTGMHSQLDTLQEITIHGTYSFRKLLSSSPATRSQYICWSVIFTKALNRRTETSVDNQFFLILINVKLTIRQFFLS